MTKRLRTTNTIYNFISSMGGQFINVIMKFVVRTVFINTLGKSYLGIDGLFSNILTMLSLAELGVGSAILFKLYEPISQDDHHRIAILMKCYKNMYRIIGTVIALIGICLIPFLPYLINDYEKLKILNINILLIFILYLLQTVSSYLFFAYKSAIIKANQKEYLLNLVNYAFTVGGSIIQIVCLLLYPKFEIYVFVMLVQIIGNNIICAKISDRLYPYINTKTNDNISIIEIKEILKDCAALFLYKLNAVVLKATDNIVLSAFLGLDMVALYSNYYVLYSSIQLFFFKIFSSTSHSLGDLHTTKNIKHEYQIFESFILIAVILGGTACVGIFSVANEFIESWVGAEWVIAQPFPMLMGLELLTLSIGQALGQYRTSMGLFQQSKYRPLAGMIINLILSIVLVGKLGIYGVLIATLISEWVTLMWFDPIIVHKYGFNNEYPVKRYFTKILKYCVVIAIVGIFDWIICQNIYTGNGWFSVILHAVVCGVTVPLALIGCAYNKQEGKYVFHLVERCIKKVTKK